MDTKKTINAWQRNINGNNQPFIPPAIITTILIILSFVLLIGGIIFINFKLEGDTMANPNNTNEQSNNDTDINNDISELPVIKLPAKCGILDGCWRVEHGFVDNGLNVFYDYNCTFTETVGEDVIVEYEGEYIPSLDNKQIMKVTNILNGYDYVTEDNPYVFNFTHEDYEKIDYIKELTGDPDIILACQTLGDSESETIMSLKKVD